MWLCNSSKPEKRDQPREHGVVWTGAAEIVFAVVGKEHVVLSVIEAEGFEHVDGSVHQPPADPLQANGVAVASRPAEVWRRDRVMPKYPGDKEEPLREKIARSEARKTAVTPPTLRWAIHRREEDDAVDTRRIAWREMPHGPI